MKTSKQLANNQVVVCDNISYGLYEYEFYSYGTLIARYRTTRGIDGNNKDTLGLTQYYDYSRTTSKWLKVFLTEYCGLWYDNTKELRKMIEQGGFGGVSIKVI